MDLHQKLYLLSVMSDGTQMRKKCKMIFEEWKFNGKITMFEKYKEQKMQDRYALPLFSVQEQSYE